MSLADRTKTEILDHLRLSQSQLALNEERITALEADLRAAREENERWHQYSNQVEKDAIYALWDDDPGVVYVAGGTSPGLVIKHFKDQHGTLRALVGELLDAWRDWSFPVDRSEPFFIDSLKAKKLDLLARAEAALNQKEPA